MQITYVIWRSSLGISNFSTSRRNCVIVSKVSQRSTGESMRRMWTYQSPREWICRRRRTLIWLRHRYAEQSVRKRVGQNDLTGKTGTRMDHHLEYLEKRSYRRNVIYTVLSLFYSSILPLYHPLFRSLHPEYVEILVNIPFQIQIVFHLFQYRGK